MNLRQFWKTLLSFSDKEEIVKWVYDNEDHIKKFINYAWVPFKYRPKLIEELNKWVNTYEYNTFNLHEKVLYFYEVAKQADINFYELAFGFPQFEKRAEYSKYFDLDSGDMRGLYSLHKIGVINLENDIVRFNSSKKQSKLTAEEKNRIKELVQQHDQQVKKQQLGYDIELPELTQEIIDQEELSLFDISVLENTNQIEYVFIDKNNRKKIYREPFQTSIRYSPEVSIFENDYFIPVEKTYRYILTNIKDYSHLRRGINDNFNNSYGTLRGAIDV